MLRTPFIPGTHLFFCHCDSKWHHTYSSGECRHEGTQLVRQARLLALGCCTLHPSPVALTPDPTLCGLMPKQRLRLVTENLLYRSPHSMLTTPGVPGQTRLRTRNQLDLPQPPLAPSDSIPLCFHCSVAQLITDPSLGASHPSRSQAGTTPSRWP